jgi:hypothetical protein
VVFRRLHLIVKPILGVIMIKNDISTSYLKNCILNGRDGEIIFSMDEKFQISPHLDGYAIIPIEEYKKLSQLDIGTKKT